MRNIHPRMHCIPCYDFLRRLENVAKLCKTTIPAEFTSMEEKTGAGIITKAYTIANSDFYNALPKLVKISKTYTWKREAEKAEVIQIMNEATEVTV